jgi:hypothetical protein
VSVSLYQHVYADGLAGMVDFADRGVGAGRVHDCVAHPGTRSKFIGRRFADWAAVKAALDQPWADGLDEVQWMLFELRQVALPPVTCQKRLPRFADQGDEVDYDRLRGGQDCWRTMRRESAAGPKTFCVVAAMTTPGNKPSLDVLWRGAVAIVLADLLEAQGHRVELWAAHRTGRAYRDGSDNFQAACLKRADEPVDIATLTNAVSGWCYRTVWFQDMASEPRSTTTSGLGHCVAISERDPAVQDLAGGADLIVIDGIWTKDAARAFAARTIETLNT